MAIIPPALLSKMTDRNLSVLEYIVIHHTASTLMDEDITDIALEEERDQGFLWAGYNFVIHGKAPHDGLIQVGRPLTKVPAAQLGLNTPGIAICLEGNFQPGDKLYTGEKPTPSQLASAITIINEWIKPKCPNLKYLIGHRDVARIVRTPSDATACPGDNLYAELHNLRVATNLTAA
jgi:hypothetical protein